MRTIAILSVVAAFAGLSVACSDGQADTLIPDPSQSEDQSTDQDEDKTEPARPVQQKQAETQAKVEQTPAPAADSKTCDPAAAKTKQDCAKCCAQKAPAKVVDSCACGQAGKCTTVCQENVCKGGLPNVECGLCLFQNGCDLGDALGDIGTEATECLQQCASKD